MNKSKILIIVLVIILITAVLTLVGLMKKIQNPDSDYITKGNIKVLKQNEVYSNTDETNPNLNAGSENNVASANNNGNNSNLSNRNATSTNSSSNESTNNGSNNNGSGSNSNNKSNGSSSSNSDSEIGSDFSEDDFSVEYEKVTTYSDSSATGFNQVVTKYLSDLFEDSKKLSSSSSMVNQIGAVLDEECIKENELTSSNLKDKLQLFTFNYKINDITYIREDDYYMTFKINVRFTDSSNNNYDRTFFFAIDLMNSTYKIYFGNNQDYKNHSEIKKNEYNIYRAVS